MNWILVYYSGQPQSIGCTITTAAGMGCYPLVVGDVYAGPHDISHYYNAAAFQNPAVATQIGQTDTSPLGGYLTPVVGPPFRKVGLLHIQAVPD